MRFLRVRVDSWISSFRYPKFQHGYQPTLPIPPPSTVLGLISAARGEIVSPKDISFGYLFFSSSRGTDLEKIYELGKNKTKTNVLKREFLFNCTLYLYLDQCEFYDYFRSPYYQLLLGRSTDLAEVSNSKIVDLEKRAHVQLGHTIMPLNSGAAGIVQPLPISFTQTIPREIEIMRPFILVGEFFEYKDQCYYDAEMEWGIWIYERGTFG
jgi:CRISPR-associated protein Cas5t